MGAQLAKLSVIYSSATGHGTAVAQCVAAAGPQVRLRHTAETRDPESFAQSLPAG